jgi:hypothetical protein
MPEALFENPVVVILLLFTLIECIIMLIVVSEWIVDLLSYFRSKRHSKEESVNPILEKVLNEEEEPKINENNIKIDQLIY